MFPIHTRNASKTMNPYASTQSQVTLPVDEHFFDEKLHLIGVTDYGVDMQQILSDPAQVPPAGTRLDIEYEGRIEGERLSGALKGVDYAIIRADGRFQLDIRGRITTDDGAPIALYADGIMKQPDANGIAQLRLNMQLTTAAPEYEWVNALQVWGSGRVNLETGQIRVSTYIA